MHRSAKIDGIKKPRLSIYFLSALKWVRNSNSVTTWGNVWVRLIMTSFEPESQPGRALPRKNNRNKEGMKSNYCSNSQCYFFTTFSPYLRVTAGPEQLGKLEVKIRNWSATKNANSLFFDEGILLNHFLLLSLGS